MGEKSSIHFSNRAFNEFRNAKLLTLLNNIQIIINKGLRIRIYQL